MEILKQNSFDEKVNLQDMKDRPYKKNGICLTGENCPRIVKYTIPSINKCLSIICKAADRRTSIRICKLGTAS